MYERHPIYPTMITIFKKEKRVGSFCIGPDGVKILVSFLNQEGYEVKNNMNVILTGE